MTQEKKVQTAIVMDVRPFEEAAQSTIRTMANAATGIAAEGERAGKGVEAIAAGADKANRSVDAATKSIGDRIRRLARDSQRELAGIAASSAGGPTSAAAVEYEATLRGADVAKLQPQIAALRELQAQTDSLNASMRQAMAGNDLLNSINARTDALQRQAQGAKLAEADLLALRAAELGVAQQAGPLIAKLRESAAAADDAARAAKRNADANNFIAGLSAQAGSIGKTRADLLELKAAELGVAQAAAPMIAAIRAADGELAGLGKNAKATQWALRGLPAQFTDIWVSLASGQDPMMVFIQQGGQIKDMFGGVGAAARAMGGYILGLINPFTLAAAGAVALFAAFKAGSDEVTKLNQAVILSGERLGVTAGYLQGVAASVASVGKVTQGAASEFLGMIAKDANVAAGDLQRFTAAALEMARVGGPSAEDTAKAFAELGKEPVAASLKLTQQFNYLTAATFEQIKALESQGKTTEAAALAQRAYADFLEQRAPRMADSLGYIERAWNSVKQATLGALDALKSIGRPDTLEQQSQAISKARDGLVSGLSNFRVPDDRRALVEQEIQRLDQRQEAIQENIRLEARAAEAGANRLKMSEAAGRLAQRDTEWLEKSKKAEQEIAAFKRDALLLSKDQEYIERGIAKIREKYAEKSGRAASPAFRSNQAELANMREFASQMDALRNIQLSATAGAEDLSKSQAKLRDVMSSPAWADFSRQQQEQIIYQASLAQSAETLADAQKLQAKIAGEAAREYEKWLEQLQRGARAAEDQTQKLIDEAEAVGLVVPGYRSLETALAMVEIARLRERQAAMLGDEDAVIAIEREIEARIKLVELMGMRDLRKASEDQAKKAADEWQKTADSIRGSLTDALLRGFESGKDFARNFRDTLKNMLATLVLRPRIEAIISPVAAFFAGAAPGQASAATNIIAQSGGGIGGVTQSLGDLYATLSGSFNAIGANVAKTAANVGAWLFTNTSGVLNEAGQTLMRYAGDLGLIAESASGAIAGLGLRRAIGGNYQIDKGFSAFQDIGVLVSTAIGGPVLGAIAGAAAGLLNRAFGRTQKQTISQGIQGTFGDGDAVGQAFNDWIKKGGWFRSDKRGTQFSDIAPEIADALDAGAVAVYAQTKAFADALELPAAALGTITSDFRVAFTDDAEANKKAIAEAINQYGEALATSFRGVLEPFQKAGESMSETLGRLAGLQVFSEGLNRLGGVFSRVAGMSVQVREEFIALFGSMDSLQKLATQFAQDYYNRDEIAGIKAAEIQTALSAAGIDASGVRTKDDFRALVDSSDVTTAAGRERLATLLQVSNAFVSVADYMAETGASLADVSSQAPESGVLAKILNTSAEALANMQVEATNGVTAAVEVVAQKIEDLAEAIRLQQEQMILWTQEVGGGP